MINFWVWKKGSWANQVMWVMLWIGVVLFQPTLGFPESIKLEPVGEEIHFNRVLGINALPGHRDHLVILQRNGEIFLLAPNEEGEFKKSLFVDLSDDFNVGSWKNASLAFHPDYLSTGRYFIWYPSKAHEKLIVVERSADESLLKDSGEDSKLLLTNVDHYRHVGGTIKFGPEDGYLYIGFGDGDKERQRLDHFWGNMLRIDVDKEENGKPYAIPPDNPFINTPGALLEIWAWGFRQPHRFSFDPVSGMLVLGEVGGGGEEINIVEKGGNYGWGCRKIDCPDDTVSAVYKYLLEGNQCIIGGDVYRGDPASPFYGKYVFGDHSGRKIYAMNLEDPEETISELESGLDIDMATFGTDMDGNMYTSYWGGGNPKNIFRLVLENNVPTTIQPKEPALIKIQSAFPWQIRPVVKDRQIQINGSKVQLQD